MPDVFLRITDFGAESPPIAVTPDIHPMAAPTLPVLRTVKQPRDDLVMRVWRLIRQERGNVLGRRRYANQVERHTSQPDAFVGFGLRDERMFAVLGCNERVDWILSPSILLRGIGNLGQ